MNCDFAQKQIMKYIDGEISENDISVYKEHIKNCDTCAMFYRNCLMTEKLIKPIEIKTDISCEKVWKHIIRKKYMHNIPSWFIAAALLLAAVLGSGIGVFHQADKIISNSDGSDYTGYKVTYVTMFDYDTGEYK